MLSPNQNSLRNYQEEDLDLCNHDLIPKQNLQQEPYTKRGNKEGFSNEIWRIKALRIMHFVSKFLTRLHHNTENLRFKFLTKKASSFEYYQHHGLVHSKATLFRKIIHRIDKLFPDIRFKRIFERFSIEIKPDSNFKLLWDIWELLVLVINVFYIPMKLSFDLDTKDQIHLEVIFDIIPLITFLIEIMINFNLQFYKEGRIHTEKKKVIKNYLKGNFSLDLLVLFPYFLKQVVSIKYIDFVLLLRISKINKIVKNIEETLDLRDKFAPVVDLVKLIYLMIIVSHFSACAWFYLGTIEESQNQASWISRYQLMEASKGSKYVNSLYWSTITLLTVGYGDIVPQTDVEKVFVIITSIFTIGVFGYSINNIGNILRDMELKKENFKNQMSRVNHYLKKKNVNKELQLKVRKYYEYYYKRNEENQNQGFKILDKLTDELQSEILIDIYKKVLSRSSFLKDTLSEACLNSLSLIVQDKQFQPDEIIFQKNQICTNLMFLNSGDVQIYYDNSNASDGARNTVIKKLKNISVFNEKGFFLNQSYVYSAQAKSYTQVTTLDFDDFMQTLKRYPEDYERFCLMKANLLYNKYYKGFNNLCEICNSNHSFNSCPFTFYQPKRDKLLQQFKQSKQMQRKTFVRNNRINFDLISTQDCALARIVDDNILVIDDIRQEYLEKLGFFDKKQQEQKQIQDQANMLETINTQRKKLNNEQMSEQESKSDSERFVQPNQFINSFQTQNQSTVFQKLHFLTDNVQLKIHHDHSEEEEIEKSFDESEGLISDNISQWQKQSNKQILQPVEKEKRSSGGGSGQKKRRSEPQIQANINRRKSILQTIGQYDTFVKRQPLIVEKSQRQSFQHYIAVLRTKELPEIQEIQEQEIPEVEEKQEKHEVLESAEESEYKRKSSQFQNDFHIEGFENSFQYSYFFPNENLEQVMSRLQPRNANNDNDLQKELNQRKYQFIQNRLKSSKNQLLKKSKKQAKL